MKYLYYNKHNVAIKVTDDNSYSGLDYLIITEQQAYEIDSKKDTHICLIKNGDIVFVFNTMSKRSRIVIERDDIINNTDIPYSLPEYMDNVLTQEQKDDLIELRIRLRNAPQHYDLSDDKENWSMKWVEEYTSGKNTNNYQLKRLDFIKWKN